MKRVRYARLTAWIAAAAILLAALAPGMARALSSPQQQATPWSDICTTAGVRVAYDPAALPGSGQHDGMGLKHCPLCLNHIGQFALPVAFDHFPVTGVGAETLPRSAPALSPRFLRAAAPARGPPVNS